MTVIAEFSIEADQFLLGRIIADFPDIAVEIERVVPTGNRIMPYIWGYGENLNEFVTAMQEHPNVKSITAVDQADNQALYKIEWEDPTEQLIAGIAETTATILKAHSDDMWTFEIRFEDHEGLVAFNEYCASHSIEYRLERVSALTDSEYFEKTTLSQNPSTKRYHWQSNGATSRSQEKSRTRNWLTSSISLSRRCRSVSAGRRTRC